MAQSAQELRLESERIRAELATTVDQLRERMSDSAEDIRYKFSPQHIKSEVSDYVSDKTLSWIGGLKQKAMENPMPTAAAGIAIAIPLLRWARGLPLPLLMIGAGLALTSKTVRDRAATAAAPAVGKAGTILDEVAERARVLTSDVKDGLSSAQSQAIGLANDVQDAAVDTTEAVGSGAAQVTSIVGDKLKTSVGAAERAAAAAKEAAAVAPEKARQVIGDNAALIGGFGIAIGAIIAAALPPSRGEAKLMGRASDSLKKAAADATQSKLETARNATMAAADAAANTIAEADLSGRASRMTQSLTDTVKEAADSVVRSAVSNPRNSNR